MSSEIIEEIIGGANDSAAIAGALGLGTAGLALAYDAYDDLGDIGRQAFREMSAEGGLADRLTGMLEFQPYTVTTATGGQFGMGQDPTTGAMTYNIAMSPEERALQQRMLTQAGQFYDQAGMSVADREEQVFERMMDAITPQQERERLALEQRLAAQGRLGTTTAQFGGTPEALALAKAQEEARNTAILNAMQFAGDEQMRQAQLGQGMLSASYIPQAQLLAALQPGMTAAEQRRAALSEQAQTYGETYTSGLQALLQSGLGQAGIAGNVGGNIASAAIGGLFS
jgi:hypothetical protein